MTCINNLPTEILLLIIEECLLKIEYMPVIGENAAWYPIPVFLKKYPELPDPDYDSEFPSLGQGKVKVVVYKSAIKTLRL